MTEKSTQKLVLAGFCLALCLALPFLTGQIPQIGGALSPMHIPVLLCGYLCGWRYGAAVGFIAPPLRFLLFGMPPIFPTGVAMAFELATYGLVTGLLHRRMRRGPAGVYLTLVVAMLAGRLVWGAARAVLSGVSGSAFTWAMFLAGAFVNALPGIVCHIALIPLIVLGLERAKLLENV